MNTQAAQMMDRLWFREDLAWPPNDRPDELRTARIFNLLYAPYMPDKELFWNEYFNYKAKGLFLLYIDFDAKEPECSYSNLQKFLDQIEEGLLIWERKPTIRFAEELTVLLGIGHPNSRTFTPRREPLPNLPFLDLGETLSPIRAAYNLSRLEANPTQKP